MRQQPLRKKRIYARDRKCIYCETKTSPDFKQIDLLQRSVNDRGGLLAGEKTGVCSKHQRYVAAAVKRARHLAMLPFVA